SKDIHTGLSKDPEVQAQMMHVMGGVYDSLGLYPQAQSLLTDAVNIRRRVLGPQNPDTLSSINGVCRLLWEQGHYAEAEKLGRETLDMRRRVLGPEHIDTLSSMSQLATILYNEGRYDEAEKLEHETLATPRQRIWSAKRLVSGTACSGPTIETP